jgi:hypothetical protein
MDEINEKDYSKICRMRAPYPANYLPLSHRQKDRQLGLLIGIMIDEGWLF